MAARRANRGISPILITGFSIFLLAGAAGVFVFTFRDGGAFRGTSELSVADYVANGNALRGNEFRTKGTIGRQLSWSRERGRLYSIKVDADGETHYLAVLVPTRFSDVNIQTDQTYHFKVEVEEAGVLIVKDLEKA